MKTILFKFAVVLLIFSGCAQHSGYNTARFRERAYDAGQIALTSNGLSAAEVAAITRTKPPQKFPLDVSVILIKDGFVSNEMEQLLLSAVIDSLKASERIDRVVPIPKFLLPQQVNFAAIQELGIRTLTEYVAVLVLDADALFKSTKIVDSKFRVTSAIDFILVDAQTTAIMASDRLLSTKEYAESLFKTGEGELAQKEVFSDQGGLLGEKIADLFSRQ